MEIPDALRPWVPEIEPSVRSMVRIGLVLAEPVAVAEASKALTGELGALSEDLAGRYRGKTPAEIDRLQEARDLYKAFGIDPTRTRPSSEALLRRALKGKPMPRVSNAVDVANLCSLYSLLPLGLYDTAKIRSPIVLRRGRPGESYPGIRKDEVHLEGRPVLADPEGAFGNPTSDSLRASVGPETRGLYMVIFAPAGYTTEAMARHVEWARQSMARHLAPQGKEVETAGAVI